MIPHNNSGNLVVCFMELPVTGYKVRLKRILVGTSSGLPYTHFFGVSTGVCFQNWWVDAQIIGTPR